MNLARLKASFEFDASKLFIFFLMEQTENRWNILKEKREYALQHDFLLLGNNLCKAKRKKANPTWTWFLHFERIKEKPRGPADASLEL